MALGDIREVSRCLNTDANFTISVIPFIHFVKKGSPHFCSLINFLWINLRKMNFENLIFEIFFSDN